MCGVFGVIVKQNSNYNHSFLKQVITTIANLSEERGKDSSGIAIQNLSQRRIEVIKGPIKISKLLKDNASIKKINDGINRYQNGENLVLIGHSRLVTNGSQLNQENNQPVIKDGIVAIHNGIIVNADKLWSNFPEIKRDYVIDTEVMLSLIRYHLNDSVSTEDAIKNTFKLMSGTYSSAFFYNDRNEITLASNNGSLYFLTNNVDILVFASENHMLELLVKKTIINNIHQKFNIVQINNELCLSINLDNFSFHSFSLKERGLETPRTTTLLNEKLEVVNTNIYENEIKRSSLVDIKTIIQSPRAKEEEKFLEYNIKAIKNLKRCTKCLLPETFPYIKFDKMGICNICNNYKPKNLPATNESLIDFVKTYRNNNNRPECLVPFSGGRDSSYMLHYIVKELKLRPITFTYDWGMVTDLARRNIARLCGELGVENIIVSADINLKRENIRKNVSAWLKNPSLGMVPLFMTGDKHFFYYINKLLKETKTEICFTGSNSLENTDFKVGFSGIDIDFNKKTIDSLSLKNKLKLFKFIGRNVIQNPSYINTSIYDSLFSFYSRYFLSREKLIFFFGYEKWNEEYIENLLIKQYDWELASDTNSSWRIGDGTAGFYNYIYYTVAGFSEIETFRSNQIREGLISREKALELAYTENKPRYESIKWYLETINLEFANTIKIINNIPKLYKQD